MGFSKSSRPFWPQVCRGDELELFVALNVACILLGDDATTHNGYLHDGILSDSAQSVI